MNDPDKAPAEQVRALDRLVGRWRITGGSQGTVTYEWMEGGHFLLQHVELEHDGGRATGLERRSRRAPPRSPGTGCSPAARATRPR